MAKSVSAVRMLASPRGTTESEWVRFRMPLLEMEQRRREQGRSSEYNMGLLDLMGQRLGAETTASKERFGVERERIGSLERLGSTEQQNVVEMHRLEQELEQDKLAQSPGALRKLERSQLEPTDLRDLMMSEGGVGPERGLHRLALDALKAGEQLPEGLERLLAISSGQAPSRSQEDVRKDAILQIAQTLIGSDDARQRKAGAQMMGTWFGGGKEAALLQETLGRPTEMESLQRVGEEMSRAWRSVEREGVGDFMTNPGGAERRFGSALMPIIQRLRGEGVPWEGIKQTLEQVLHQLTAESSGLETAWASTALSMAIMTAYRQEGGPGAQPSVPLPGRTPQPGRPAGPVQEGIPYPALEAPF